MRTGACEAKMLTNSPICFLFIDVTTMTESRLFFEQVLGLPVIEHQWHPPHHRHGVIKYDAGAIILSLNLAEPPDPTSHKRDGIVVRVFVPDRGKIFETAVARGFPVRGDTILDAD